MEFIVGNARAALQLGIREFNFPVGARVLCPNYICAVVKDSLSAVDLEPIFYTIDDSFLPDWDALTAAVVKAKPVAILMVHYFGQPQEIDKFIQFSKKHSLILIEDNAHGHGGYFFDRLLGSYGDIGFSSPRKMLNIPSGGIIFLKNKPLGVEKKFNLELIFDLKSILIFVIKRSFLLKKLTRKIKYFKANWSDNNLFKDNGRAKFKPDPISSFIIKNTNWDVLAKKRRDNWRYWSDFAKKNGLRPVFEDVKSCTCPWAFPAYAGSLSERNKWLDWGIKEGYTVFSWPNLPISIVDCDPAALKRWNSLLCFALDEKQGRQKNKVFKIFK
jgi:hypothetical protein